MMRALESRDEISHEKAAVYECCSLIAGAAYYRSVKAAGIADKMRARHEAAHAVSEQDKRNVRIGLLHCKTKYLLVLHDIIPTVFLGEKAHLLGLFNALTVAEMVCTDGNETVRRKKRHKIIIAAYVLGNTVHYLHDRAHLPVGNTSANMDAVFARA